MITHRGAHRLLPALTATLLALPATGCSAPSSGSSPPATSAPSGASTTTSEPPPAELRRLAEGLILPPRTRQLVSDAEASLVGTCMAKHGFMYFSEPLTLAAARATEENRTRELRGDDVNRARREGFGGTAPTPVTGAERRESAYLATLPRDRRDAWDRVLHGDRGQRMIKVEVPGVGTMEAPTTGCFASARMELYGDYAKWVGADAFVTSRYLPVNEAVRKQPSYARATQRWSACMRANGHRFADPGEAARSGEATGEGPAAVRLAVASAVCDEKTGRSRTHRQLFWSQTLRWVKEHPAEAHAFGSLNRQAAERAAALTER
ncbi:hypothetical protein [Streptomyces cyaneofuscatus]|uniref:hypothetical protein n=1 Tax=Streptomyces cyaneofuscatus TaxID=66883 RepID=UPI00365DD2A5